MRSGSSLIASSEPWSAPVAPSAKTLVAALSFFLESVGLGAVCWSALRDGRFGTLRFEREDSAKVARASPCSFLRGIAIICLRSLSRDLTETPVQHLRSRVERAHRKGDLTLARLLRLLLYVAVLAVATRANAGEATVAVAANFAGTLEKLQKDFEAKGGHRLTLVRGATGKLTAQIMGGAPFDVFLSADDEATRKLVESGDAIADSQFTYAVGALALFSADPQFITDGPAVLKEGQFRHLAIANLKLAPYGAAAQETMTALGVRDGLMDRIVMGENIGQTFMMIESGSAKLGFVALAQVLGSQAGRSGSHWAVPADLHSPIRQNAVLLTSAQENDAARAFLQFLKSPKAREQIQAAGYRLVAP